jgi:hypothetical protein
MVQTWHRKLMIILWKGIKIEPVATWHWFQNKSGWLPAQWLAGSSVTVEAAKKKPLRGYIIQG